MDLDTMFIPYSISPYMANGTHYNSNFSAAVTPSHYFSPSVKSHGCFDYMLKQPDATDKRYPGDVAFAGKPFTSMWRTFLQNSSQGKLLIGFERRS
jgi:hypothetical protein